MAASAAHPRKKTPKSRRKKTKKRVGRPSYVPSQQHFNIAYRGAKNGLNHEEIAVAIGISLTSLKRNLGLFGPYMKKGKDEGYDVNVEKVENALLRRCLGHEWVKRKERREFIEVDNAQADKPRKAASQGKSGSGEDSSFYRGGKIADDRSQNLLEQAIKAGTVTRPASCERCGAEGKAKDGRASIQAHHTDYNKPLEVQWLCPKCHHEWHKAHKAKTSTGGIVKITQDTETMHVEPSDLACIFYLVNRSKGKYRSINNVKYVQVPVKRDGMFDMSKLDDEELAEYTKLSHKMMVQDSADVPVVGDTEAGELPFPNEAGQTTDKS